VGAERVLAGAAALGCGERIRSQPESIMYASVKKQDDRKCARLRNPVDHSKST
jgi:hypothetical protein